MLRACENCILKPTQRMLSIASKNEYQHLYFASIIQTVMALSIQEVIDLINLQLSNKKSYLIIFVLFAYKLIIKYPFALFYYLYLWIPILIFKSFVYIIGKVVNIITKKSVKARQILRHVIATFNLIENAIHKITKTKFSELISITSQTIVEV